MHSKGKAAATGTLVKRDHEPLVAECYSEPLVHSYLFQVCLQPAMCVDPGCLCWEGILDPLQETGSTDAISAPSQRVLCFWHWCFQLQTLMNVPEAPGGTKVKKKMIKQKVARIALSFFAC